jgi:hypothetical protein
MHLYKWLRLCGEAWPSTAAEVQKHTHDTEYVAPRTPGRNITIEYHTRAIKHLCETSQSKNQTHLVTLSLNLSTCWSSPTTSYQ